MNLEVTFRNEGQRDFYYSTARNQCFSGGFNNGKTFIGCSKIRDLAVTYANSHWLLARQTFTDLKKTTLQTFFKVCPKELIKSFNAQDGVITLFNGSIIFLFHLDSTDESTLRGFEINGYLIDQAEETDEKTFDILDARIGRWDEAIVPKNYLDQYPEWPKSSTGKYITPSYGMLLCNPDNEFHYIWRKFHYESPDRIPSYFYIEGEWDRQLGSEETYDITIQNKDQEWIDKYVRGKWGVSSAAIHHVPKDCLLEPTTELIDRIYKYGNLYRSMDHGDSSPTCCLWVAALDGVYIFYREYYSPGHTISYHRQSIHDLSTVKEINDRGDIIWVPEKYRGNYADPQIFKKTAQKDGGFWSVSDEYITSDLDAPSLHWMPADNNEFATRNRINELLNISSRFTHPVTKTSPAAGLYFVKATADYPYGCKEAHKQLGSQRKVLLGTLDGKSIYSDDRDENITDHAYDPIRYFVAMHGSQPNKSRKVIPRRSFEYYNQIGKILNSRDRNPNPLPTQRYEY
jgi:hypothetical protein